ncbi:MAG: PilZ domain-containing protein [Kiloniellaceae bacterium]
MCDFPSTTPDVANGRRAERRQWFRRRPARPVPARLIADGRALSCAIADISPTGARLALAGAAPPFNLEVRLEHPEAGSIYGNLAWAGPDSIGIAFRLSARGIRLLGLAGDSRGGLAQPGQDALA